MRTIHDFSIAIIKELGLLSNRGMNPHNGLSNYCHKILKIKISYIA